MGRHSHKYYVTKIIHAHAMQRLKEGSPEADLARGIAMQASTVWMEGWMLSGWVEGWMPG